MRLLFKKIAAASVMAAMLLTSLPYQLVMGSLEAYNRSLNVVDKLWSLKADKNVVDNFISWKEAERFRVPEAYAAVGDARMQYGRSTNAAPLTRLYNNSTNSWGANSALPAGTANVGWTVSKESPTEDVTVTVTQSTTGKLDIFCRSGDTWSKDVSNITIGTTAATRRFDLDFEKTSGVAMVLYSRNVATTNELGYLRKTGPGCGAGAWTAENLLDPTRITGTVLWVELKNRQTAGSNAIAAAFSDSSATQGGRLEAMVWSGSAWGSESPAAAANGWSDSSIELQGTAGANAAKVFDLAFESLSGDLIVAWGTSLGANGTNGFRYATCGNTYPCTWSVATAPAGLLDDATNVACSPDPASDAVACVSIGNAGSDLQAWTWTGTAVGAVAANADTATLAPAAGLQLADIDWVIAGSQRMAVAVYANSTGSRYNYIYYDTAGNAWRTNAAAGFGITVAPSTAAKHIQVVANPSNASQLLLNFTDANSDLWSKRLAYNGGAGGATTALAAWSNADGGVALETTVSSIISMPFWTEWVRVAPSNALTVSATAGSQAGGLSSGGVSQYANDTACAGPASCAAFTLSVSQSAVTLTSLKVSETGTANATADLSNLTLFYDTDGNFANGVSGQYGSTVASFDASQAANVAGSLVLNPGTTYYFYVRFDLKSGTPTYPVGGQTIGFALQAAGDLVASPAPIITGAPAALAGNVTVRPDATSTTWGSGLSDGARSGETITVSGYGFGVAPAGSRGTCAGAANTGCLRFTAGGNDTVADAQVTAWSNTSISFAISPTLASYGGSGALEIVAASQADTSKLAFIIYPKITAIAAIGSNAAREYDAGDADGLIMLAGDHLGAAGTVTILGSPASEHAVAEGSCSVGGYTADTVCLEVPAAISDSLYTGNIVLTRDSDSKTHAYANFRILPRLLSLAPASGAANDAVTLNGNHFCQGGACPTGFDASNKVAFAGADAAAFTSWSDIAIVTAVPVGAVDGQVTVLSNTYLSNGKPFSVISPVPGDPANLNQFKDAALSQALAVGQGATSTPLYLAFAMQADQAGGTLYPQVEVKPVGANFVCGAGACAGAVEGAGKAGPGPIDCTQAASGCAIASSPADDAYHWQARVRHNKSGVDYYSNWVSFGANGEAAVDFALDSTGPAISFGGGDTCADAVTDLQSNQATIGFNLSESASGQIEYSQAADLSAASLFPTPAAPAAFSHSLVLPNLNSNTTYYFRVRAVDSAGNEARRPSAAPFCSFTTQNVTQPAKTVKFYAGSLTGQVAGGATASSSFLVHIPESPIAIKSAFLELAGISAANGTNDVMIQLNGQAPETTSIESKDSGFKILYKVLPANLNLDPVANVLSVTPSLATDIISARIIVTYAFTP